MARLYPGADVEHKFTVPFASTDVSSARVAYKQLGEIIFVKEAGNFTEVDDEHCYFTVLIPQEETISFQDNFDISAQINLFLLNGRRVTSSPITIRTGEQYERRVIR